MQRGTFIFLVVEALQHAFNKVNNAHAVRGRHNLYCEVRGNVAISDYNKLTPICSFENTQGNRSVFSNTNV
jgi:hypothetical protein